MKYLAAFVAIFCAFTTSAFAATPEELLERVRSEGIGNIVSRPETLRDRDLDYLDLVANLLDDADQKAVQKARKLRGMPEVTESGYAALPGGTPKHLRELASSTRSDLYRIYFSNLAKEPIEEVAVFYRTTLNAPGMQNVRGLPFRSTHEFQLGACTVFKDYVIGVFMGGQLVAKIPAQGNMTPAMAASVNPQDKDRCIDHWHLAVEHYVGPGSL